MPKTLSPALLMQWLGGSVVPPLPEVTPEQQAKADALAKAWGLRHPTRTAIADAFTGAIDMAKGALVGSDVSSPRSQQFGELLAAGVPVLGMLGKLSKTERVGEAVAEAAPKAIRAFHGSPHDFDHFSLSKIGTGEGAQAYGHGLYFAENEGVARGYKEALSGPQQRGYWSQTDPMTVGGKSYQTPHQFAETFGNPESPEYRGALEAAQAWSHHGSPYLGGGDIAELIARDKTSKNPLARAYGIAAEALQTAHRPTGRMYEVNIHADPNDFLDWDAPLSQQQAQKASKALGDVRPVKQANGYYGVTRVGPDGSGKMIQGINESSAEAAMSRWHSTFEGMSGANANTVLSGIAGDKAAVTEGLKAQGIPGIKYYDQGSRTAGQGTRNYVVFDDKLISIVKKYGVVGALGAGLINQTQADALKKSGY